MTHHFFALTIDIDPDGLSGIEFDRGKLEWPSVPRLPWYTDTLPSFLDAIPVTWFIRVDGQIRESFGDALYLFAKFGGFWDRMRFNGHELAWHPHLYRIRGGQSIPVLITDPTEAQDELYLLWEEIMRSPMRPTAFRSGEGWLCSSMLDTVEKLGMEVESSVIPGRRGSEGNPMNWLAAPNHPYYPAPGQVDKAGLPRPILEMPLNTWTTKAPYDKEPKIRYMNPCVHESIFRDATVRWVNNMKEDIPTLCAWVLIFHPDEIVTTETGDLLYTHSCEAVARNLQFIAESIQQAGGTVSFLTLTEMARQWRYQGYAQS